MFSRARKVSSTIAPHFAARAQAHRKKREDEFKAQAAFRKQEAHLLKPVYDAILATIPQAALAQLTHDRNTQRDLVLKALDHLPPLPGCLPITERDIMYLEWLFFKDRQ